jgi:hypothetical protein
MHSKFKALGLALVAVFAMSALTASAASAVNFKGESNPTHVTGATGLIENVFATTGGTVKCKNVNIKDEVELKTELTTISAEPVYTNCTASGQTTTIAFNGCKYNFTASSTTAGNVSITCPAGKEIVVSVGDPGVICTIKIKAQTPGVSTIDYAAGTSGGKADVTITSTVDQIEYTSSGSVCGTAGTFKEAGAGKYTGTVTVSGYSNAAHTTLTGVSII